MAIANTQQTELCFTAPTLELLLENREVRISGAAFMSRLAARGYIAPRSWPHFSYPCGYYLKQKAARFGRNIDTPYSAGEIEWCERNFDELLALVDLKSSAKFELLSPRGVVVPPNERFSHGGFTSTYKETNIASELLALHGVVMGAERFNVLLEHHGFTVTARNNRRNCYVSGRGAQYGVNVLCADGGYRVEWYAHSFSELLSKVLILSPSTSE